MNKLTPEEKLKLGEKCECVRCEQPGTYMINPYNRDIHNEEILVCYCEDCAYDARMDI